MVEVERVTMSSSITATGTVEPVSQVEVGTQVSGIVSRLYVDYNSEVKKGQVIAELDKTNLMSDLESKKATFRQRNLIMKLRRRIMNVRSIYTRSS